MSHSGAAGGGQLEEKVDLSAEVVAKLEQAKTLMGSGGSSNLTETLALLAALEKRCRVGNDTPSLIKVCTAAVQHCKDAENEAILIQTLQTLSTRRSQKSAAISAMVQLAFPWVLVDKESNLPHPSLKNDDLIVALRDMTDGKIFLEAERAQLTRALATMKENAGDIDGAATVLQEVHVETYGSLSKKDKVEFILEQLRLTLAKKDYIRAAIVAGKISPKQFQDEASEMQQHKVQFYTLMAQYHVHEKDALNLAKDYHAIYSTPMIQSDTGKWQMALKCCVLFLGLSEHSSEQQDLMNRVFEKDIQHLEILPASYATLELLLQPEIISYPLSHQVDLEQVLFESLQLLNDEGGDNESKVEEEDIKYWKELLHRRVIQHNIRVVSKYYKRIHGERLAKMLALDRAALESEISTMVSSGSLYCKVDRPADIIRFSPTQTPEAVLTSWASDIDKLLGLVERTTHLIQKENMTK